MDSAADTSRAELAPLVEAVRRADYAFAIEQLKAFLDSHPDHEIAAGLLAASYFQLGMHERARTLYERLLVVHPENALVRFQLGLLRSSDDPREALGLWAPLLSAPGEFMAHFHSALACLQLNDKAAAKRLLERAALHMPQSHPLRAQLDQLLATHAASPKGYGR